MGIADAILDLVSSGTTLRENNLKEIEGGVVLESQVSFYGPQMTLPSMSCCSFWTAAKTESPGSWFYILSLY